MAQSCKEICPYGTLVTNKRAAIVDGEQLPDKSELHLKESADEYRKLVLSGLTSITRYCKGYDEENGVCMLAQKTFDTWIDSTIKISFSDASRIDRDYFESGKSAGD